MVAHTRTWEAPVLAHVPGAFPCTSPGCPYVRELPIGRSPFCFPGSGSPLVPLRQVAYLAAVGVRKVGRESFSVRTYFANAMKASNASASFLSLIGLRITYKIFAL